MAVLFYFQFKSLNDIETTSAVVLRQLSSETADSLTRSIEDYLKRPHISVLLRIPQARTEPLDLRVHRADLQRRAGRKPVRRIVLRLDRGRAAGQQVAGVRPGEQGAAERRAGTVPRRQGPRRPAAGAAARAGQDPPRHRRVHREHQRPAALRAGAAALRGPGARAHDQRAGVCRRRREAAHAVHSRGAARLAGERPAAVGVPAPRDRSARRRRRAHLRVASGAVASISRRSTSAASRSSSSTRSCSNSRRRTNSTARSGACGPATVRSRFRKSSAPARGRSRR